MKIQDILSTIVAAIPGAPFPETVDTVKTGDPSAECTGIVVTFMATVEVIEQAAKLNANLIITHEPTFYEHFDNADWMKDNSAVSAKRRLIDKYGIVIWRFHDYMHSIQPDPTVASLIRTLGFDPHPDLLYCCRVPALPLRDLVRLLKQKLELPTVRVVGDLDKICHVAGVLPGIPPTQMQIGLFDQQGVDVLICGEINEWETPEYARDARRLGSDKALIVVGHAASEEPGIHWVLSWLQERLPGETFHFVPTSPLFQAV